MTAVLAAGCAGGAVLAIVVLGLRRRLDLVARAEHELRAPATAFLLAVERMRRDPAGRRHAAALESELERLQVALADLSAARRGRRAAPRPRSLDLQRAARGSVAAWRSALERGGRSTAVRWHAPGTVARADPGRMAQALGNLLANAAEHGQGPTELVAKPAPAGVVIEVTTAGAKHGVRGRDRGRGLPIAAAAARDLGGRMTVERGDGRFTARLELPLGEERGPGGRAAA